MEIKSYRDYSGVRKRLIEFLERHKIPRYAFCERVKGLRGQITMNSITGFIEDKQETRRFTVQSISNGLDKLEEEFKRNPYVPVTKMAQKAKESQALGSAILQDIIDRLDRIELLLKPYDSSSRWKGATLGAQQ